MDYRATNAQWHAERRAVRPKVSKLAANDAALRAYVQDRLAGAIKTPEGVVPGPRFAAGMVAATVVAKTDTGRFHGARNRSLIDSNSIFLMTHLRESLTNPSIKRSTFNAGEALKREVVTCLGTGRALRVPRARRRNQGRHFVSPELMSSERPSEACDRAVPGHWEGDLIIGLNRSAIGTLGERTTRFTNLLHLSPMDGHDDKPRIKNGPALAGHGAEAVRDAIAEAITTLPAQRLRSLTWEQGAEMAQHTQLRMDTGLAIYFCDPRSPWQRGTNENENGLRWQYFPKGTDLSRHSPTVLDAVAATLNSRLSKVPD